MFISQLGEIPHKVSGVNLDSTLRHNVDLRLQFPYKNVFSSCFLIKTRKESFLVHICDSRQSVSSSLTKAATLLCPGYTEILVPASPVCIVWAYGHTFSYYVGINISGLVLGIYCCVTSYSESYWLKTKTTNYHLSSVSIG